MNRIKKKRHADSRNDGRISTEVTVICRPYASTGNVRSAKGVMRNFSSQGSYIETDREFKSGTILVVRTVSRPATPASADNDEKPRSICLCEIKWGQDLTDVDESCYGMGVRYID